MQVGTYKLVIYSFFMPHNSSLLIFTATSGNFAKMEVANFAGLKFRDLLKGTTFREHHADLH